VPDFLLMYVLNDSVSPLSTLNYPLQRMYTLVDLKPGRAVTLEGQPYLVVSSQFGRKSQSKANMQCKLKNLKTGAVIARNFQGSEKIEEAEVGFKHVQFLYSYGDSFTFMDLSTYDQFDLDKETVGDAAQYLMDGQELDAMMFEERPIAVKLPPTVDMQVKETIPGVKGDTATGGTKPATFVSGLKVSVPLFVNEGDTIKINTDSGTYMGRVE